MKIIIIVLIFMIYWQHELLITTFKNYSYYRFTSSADCAIKNPCVLATILAPRGLIDILLSLEASPLISIANNRSFNFVKQSL